MFEELDPRTPFETDVPDNCCTMVTRDGLYASPVCESEQMNDDSWARMGTWFLQFDESETAQDNNTYGVECDGQLNLHVNDQITEQEKVSEMPIQQPTDEFATNNNGRKSRAQASKFLPICNLEKNNSVGFQQSRYGNQSFYEKFTLQQRYKEKFVSNAESTSNLESDATHDLSSPIESTINFMVTLYRFIRPYAAVGTSLSTAWISGSVSLLWGFIEWFVVGITYSANVLPLLRWKRFPFSVAFYRLIARALVIPVGYYLHMQIFTSYC